MRISDWSSDVCSSDLIDGRKQLTGILLGLDAGRIAIDVKKFQTMTVDFADIADATLLMTDALIAATQPLSAEAAAMVLDVEGYVPMATAVSANKAEMLAISTLVARETRIEMDHFAEGPVAQHTNPAKTPHV